MRQPSYILSVMRMTLHRGKTALTAALTLALCAAALVFSPRCKDGAAKGLELCLRVLTPSLFPMMALSGLAVRTGLCRRIGRLLEKPTRVLFGLSGAFAPVVLLSLVGGYPVGARAIADLYRGGQVGRRQAERAALFCVGAGPAFLISFVGSALYGSEEIGMILLCSQVLAVVLSGIVLRIFGGKIKDNSNEELSVTAQPFSAALVEATRDASAGMAGIVGLVVLFAALTGICEEMLPACDTREVLLSLLDVSTGVCRLQGGFPLTLTAFAVGFGGVCVHFQVFAALRELAPHKLLFLAVRFVQGGLTAVFTFIGMTLFGREVAVFSTAAVGQAGFYGGSVLSGAALLAVAVGFLFTFKKQ